MLSSSAFTGLSAFPPSFAGQPLTYMWAVFGLLLLELLVLEWIWRLALAIGTERRGLHDPITINRVILLLLLLCPVIGGIPDLILMMKWADWTPAAREAASMVDRQLDGLLWIPASAAWLLAQVAGALIDWQLVREPLPINLWPTGRQMARPIKILLGVLVLAFAVTFSR